MPKATKKKNPKPEAKKLYKIRWELAAPFLLRGFRLVEVRTKGKEMIAEMHAPDKSKS